PIAAAMTLFAEPLPGGVLGGLRIAAFGAVVAGAVALSPRHTAGQAERQESPAQRGAAQPPPRPAGQPPPALVETNAATSLICCAFSWSLNAGMPPPPCWTWTSTWS